ncbi:MAG: DUF432 domain-containing protein [candidate division KSB1 bacterium]|nr:DUF432 domain-containing protein [candidate division KSB1 bacterium]
MISHVEMEPLSGGGGSDGDHRVPWGPLEVRLDELHELVIGPLHLYLERRGDELLIAYQHNGEGVGNGETAGTAGLLWQRFVVGEAKLSLAPALPDRSVVIQSENPFWLPVGAKAEFFVEIPAWVQLRLHSGTETTLVDVPTVPLSQTWFGTFTDGELCYWLRTAIRREPPEPGAGPHWIVCPVDVRNEGGDKLLVDYFCLRVRALSLYLGGQRLWTDVFSLTFRGERFDTRQWPTGRRAKQAKKARWLSGPREVMRKSVIARTFSQGGDLPGIGIRIL